MYLADDRYLYLDTPLGKNVLHVAEFHGQESISRLFEFRLGCKAKRDDNIDFSKLIGQKVGFGVLLGANENPQERAFHGVVIEASQGGRDEEFISYNLTVVPDLWRLTCKVRSRIFQQMNIPDVLKSVFAEIKPIEWKLAKTYEERNYLTQYRESDFDFASRLMEEEGIYYYFKFKRGEHTLVVGDLPTTHAAVPGKMRAPYLEISQGAADQDGVFSWTRSQHWGPGNYTVWDSHFQKTADHFEKNAPILASVKAGQVDHKLLLSGNDQMEIYEYPGSYVKRFDEITKAGGPGGTAPHAPGDAAKLRAQHGEMNMLVFRGEGDMAHFTAGHKFEFAEHFNANDTYVLTSVTHSAFEGAMRSGSGAAGDYRNAFTCIPLALPFVPAHVTAKPVIAGAQTAFVTGAKGEEITTDKYGRVKVQFQWDRDLLSSAKRPLAESSCWLRVASHAGGAVHSNIRVPRVGEEVIVTFLEGDPDQPIITGSVYNNRAMPPYTLPDRKTVSTLKSHSTPKGSADNYNELRFEDKKGSEQVYLQAEKNLDIWVKSDQSVNTGHDKHEVVGHDSASQVGHDMELTVGANQSTSIGANADLAIGANYSQEVGLAHSLSVATTQDIDVGKDHALAAGMDIHLKAGMNVVIEAGMELTLKSSGGFITIGPSGVSIQGTMVLINSGGAPGSGKGAQKKKAKKPAIKVKDAKEYK